jgi:hypothetical protein
LKSCVHCQESIADGASSCRYCGKAQPAGVLEITERGRRYGVGPTDDGQLGLWNLELGGEPLATWDDSDRGWGRALVRMESLEGRTGRRTALGWWELAGGIVLVLIGLQARCKSST